MSENLIEQLLATNQRLLEKLDANQQIHLERNNNRKSDEDIEKEVIVPQQKSKEFELKNESLFIYCKSEPTSHMLKYVSSIIGNISESIEIPKMKRNVIQITIKELRNLDKARKLLQDKSEQAPVPYFVSSKFKNSEQTIILPGLTQLQVDSELKRIFDRKLYRKVTDLCINNYRGRYNLKINLCKEDDRVLFPNYNSYVIGYDKRLTLTCNFPSYYQIKDIIDMFKEKCHICKVEFTEANMKNFIVKSKLNPGRNFIKLMYKTNNETEMNKMMNSIILFGRNLKPLINSIPVEHDEKKTRPKAIEKAINDSQCIPFSFSFNPTSTVVNSQPSNSPAIETSSESTTKKDDQLNNSQENSFPLPFFAIRQPRKKGIDDWS